MRWTARQREEARRLLDWLTTSALDGWDGIVSPPDTLRLAARLERDLLREEWAARYREAEERRQSAAPAHAARTAAADLARAARDAELLPEVERLLLQRGLTDRAIARHLTDKAMEAGGDGRGVGPKTVKRLRESLGLTVRDLQIIRDALDSSPE